MMEVKAKLDMEHGFMQSIIRNQVDRLINLKLVNIFFPCFSLSEAENKKREN